MTPFYSMEERITALRFHAAELVGTPFAPHAMVPGCGIDCIHVNAWVYLKTGFLKEFKPPKYAMDSGKHSHESQLLNWLDANKNFQRGVATLQAGDSICFNMGLSEHHVGLMTGDVDFVHCLFFGPRKVIVSSLNEHYYLRRVSAIYRPIEVQP